jgi:hypothetical protein
MAVAAGSVKRRSIPEVCISEKNPPSFSAERAFSSGLKPVPQDVFDIFGEQTVRHLPPTFFNWLPEIMLWPVFEHLEHTVPYRELQFQLACLLTKASCRCGHGKLLY